MSSGQNRTTILDFVDDEEEFDELLIEAYDCVTTPFEENFVNSAMDAFEEYGQRMLLSEKQFELLKSIIDKKTE